MPIHSSLRTRAVAHSGLNALIAGRFRPGEVPQGETLPVVTFFQVSGPPESEVPKMYRARYQFNCWGATYIDAKAVAVQVAEAFCDDWSDRTGTPQIMRGRKLNELDAREQTTDRWRAVVDIEFLVAG